MSNDARKLLHELNNALAVIVSYTELLVADLPDGDARRADTAEIEQAARRAAAIVTQLRDIIPR